MAKRSLLQIQEGLRKKLAEADPFNPLGDIGRTSPHRGDPIMSPELGGGQGPGGAGGGGSKSTGAKAKRIEPTLGTPAAPVRPNIISKNQWKKLTPDQKQDMANKLGSPKPEAPTSKPETTSLPPKPFFQSEKKYVKSLSNDQLKRYRDEQEILKANKMGLGTKTAIGATVGTAGVAGLGALPFGAEKKDTATTPAADAQQPPTANAEPPASTDTSAEKPAPPQDDTDTQAGLPAEEPSADIETPATTVKPAAPLQAYPPGTKFSKDELLDSYSRVLDKYRIFLNEQQIDLELEKHFPDPNVRRAIAAKVSRESGGRNIGELDWTKTANKSIKTSFPQLKNLDDNQLNQLKAQGNEAFLNYAYRNIGGYQYRGRGPIQITGRANYEKLDKDLGLKGALIKDPDLLLKDPEISKAATVQYLKNAGLDRYQAKDPKDAAQRVITAIGGKAYAPGTKLGTRELSAVEKLMPGTPDTSVAVAQTAPPVSTAPVTAPKPVTSVEPVSTAASTPIVPDTTVAAAKPPAKPAFKDVFDYEAFHQASQAGQDLSDLSKFMKVPAKTTAAGLSERYERFKAVTI